MKLNQSLLSKIQHCIKSAASPEMLHQDWMENCESSLPSLKVNKFGSNAHSWMKFNWENTSRDVAEKRLSLELRSLSKEVISRSIQVRQSHCKQGKQLSMDKFKINPDKNDALTRFEACIHDMVSEISLDKNMKQVDRDRDARCNKQKSQIANNLVQRSLQVKLVALLEVKETFKRVIRKSISTNRYFDRPQNVHKPSPNYAKQRA